MERTIRAAVVLLAGVWLVACSEAPYARPGPYGELYLPTANGARVAALPADCLVSGNPCPPPVNLSLYPPEWNIAELTWSPDGAVAAVTSADKPNTRVALFSPPSRLLRRFAALPFIREAAWSPDGTQLAVTGVARHDAESPWSIESQINGASIFLYSAGGKELGNLAEDLPGMKSDVNWLAPDTLLFQNFASPQDCDIYKLALSSGETTPWAAMPLCDAAPAISPDGAQVAYVHDGNLFLADAGASEHMLILDLAEDIARPHWSPDGQWIGFDEINPMKVGIVHPDGTDYRQVGDKVHNEGFAPLTDQPLLLSAAVHSQTAGNATANWFVTQIPDGPTRAIVVPGIPPAAMPLNISWRPPERQAP